MLKTLSAVLIATSILAAPAMAAGAARTDIKSAPAATSVAPAAKAQVTIKPSVANAKASMHRGRHHRHLRHHRFHKKMAAHTSHKIAGKIAKAHLQHGKRLSLSKPVVARPTTRRG